MLVVLRSWVIEQDAGDAKMTGIARAPLAEGAMAFLKAEYGVTRCMLQSVAGIALGLLSMHPKVHEHSSILIVLSFVIGSFFSALAGFIGMNVATKANVRTTQAARTSLAKALKVSFAGGTVMGLGVAGLAVVGLCTLFIFFQHYMGGNINNGGTEMMKKVLEIIAGFSVGAESIALFARVGGGIYTKAADVGADLVGKVEAGIPQDDPRNPATIADNVGDNVGDVAGMGADLFGSYVATVLASMVLGNFLIGDNPGLTASEVSAPILLPMTIAAVGIIASIIGALFVSIKDDKSSNTDTVQNALNRGNWVSIIIALIASFFLIKTMLPETMEMTMFTDGDFASTQLRTFLSMRVYSGQCVWAMFVGAAISVHHRDATQASARSRFQMTSYRKSGTGAATNIIAGLGTGMLSTFFPVLLFAGAIWAAYALAGLYGVGIAASAMMATTAMQLAIRCFRSYI
jgi:K(+)-stimulated pyrophosphate-energized sodium pump